MAILPVSNMIQPQPDFLGSYNRGMQVGQQQAAYKQQLADKNALRELAPGIVSGENPQAFQQAAAIDPAAAQAYQTAGDGQLRRLTGFIKYIDDAKASGNPQALNAALKSAGPYVSQFLGGRPIPEQWTPDMDAGWETLKARVAGAGGGTQGRVQSTYIDGEGNRVAIMADGSTSVLGKNDPGMSQQTITVEGADGRPRQFTFDKRAGKYVPAELGAPSEAPTGAPAPQIPAKPSAAVGSDHLQNFQGLASSFPGTQITSINRSAADNSRVGGVANSQHMKGTAGDFVVPQAQRPAFIAQARGMGYEAIDEGDHIHLELPPGQRTAQAGGNQFQNTQPVVSGPSPFVGRSPEEQAALTERAKSQVQQEYLPAELGMRRDAAVQQAVQIDEGKNAAEKAAAAPATIATLQSSIDSIDSLLNSPDLDSIVGLGSMNPLNRIPGTAARGLIARADQIAGQAFLAAFNQLKGGGAITEREGAAATAAMARLDRSQGIEDYKRALNDLKAAITPAIQRAKQQQGGGSRPAPPSGSWSIQRVE